MVSNRETVHIDQIILDPNNYRFIDKVEYKQVPEEQLSDDRIQLRTLNFIWGRSQDNIKDLITSFKENGFLDIEQIQVKRVGDKYLVLEGNRRTSTLKFLWDEYNKGNDIGNVNPESFSNIPVVVIDEEDPVQHLITMGLHHISGKTRWSAVNEAQLMNDLIEKYSLSEDDVCKKLGISKYTLRRSRRTLYFINEYKSSDFGDQFKSDMFYIFQSIVGSPTLKEWLEWDDDEYTATNSRNRERLFNWLSATDDEEFNEEENEKTTKKNLSKREPIINQYRQIKTLEQIVWDENALRIMEDSGDLTKAYTFSKAVGESKLQGALYTIKEGTQLAYNFKDLITSNDLEELKSIKASIDNLLPVTLAKIHAEERKTASYFNEIKSHFTEIKINRYRKFEDLSIKHINRVNIFAGGNNKGKTTILETFYLLTQSNNLNALIDLARYRGKFSGEFNSRWVDKYFNNSIEINGYFNSQEIDLLIHKEETDDDIDKTGYLSSLVVESEIGNNNLKSTLHLFSNKAPDYRYSKTQVLCNAAFTSPYRHNEKLVQQAHNQAIENRYFEKVIQFIREHLDSSITNIDLVNEQGDFRFRVTSSSKDYVLDITEYGEGLQRIFEIALLLGYCKNGVLCIDEVDSAIHKSLLIKFTEFIQKVAKDFNVQVFLSTHSKECIDAFVENDFPDDELTAFALEDGENGRIECNFLAGNKLKQLVETINIDIR
ncbi:MAG: AAA family ATPase [Bacteroidetes bacterium]|nr:AAA family ATPase [Bacteroidota bacterium]